MILKKRFPLQLATLALLLCAANISYCQFQGVCLKEFPEGFESNSNRFKSSTNWGDINSLDNNNILKLYIEVAEPMAYSSDKFLFVGSNFKPFQDAFPVKLTSKINDIQDLGFFLTHLRLHEAETPEFFNDSLYPEMLKVLKNQTIFYIHKNSVNGIRSNSHLRNFLLSKSVKLIDNYGRIDNWYYFSKDKLELLERIGYEIGDLKYSNLNKQVLTIKQFQRDFSLNQTGLLDRRTLTTLFRLEDTFGTLGDLGFSELNLKTRISSYQKFKGLSVNGEYTTDLLGLIKKDEGVWPMLKQLGYKNQNFKKSLQAYFSDFGINRSTYLDNGLGRIIDFDLKLLNQLNAIGIRGPTLKECISKFVSLRELDNVTRKVLMDLVTDYINKGHYFLESGELVKTALIKNKGIERKTLELASNIYVNFDRFNLENYDKIKAKLFGSSISLNDIEVLSLIDDYSTQKSIEAHFPNNHLKFGLTSQSELIRRIKTHSSKTIFILGHIEDGKFVIRDSQGAIKFEIELREVERFGDIFNANIFPIGCNSAEFGTGIAAEFNSLDIIDRLSSGLEKGKSYGDILAHLADNGRGEPLKIFLNDTESLFSQVGDVQLEVMKKLDETSQVITLGVVGSIIIYLILDDDE